VLAIMSNRGTCGGVCHSHVPVSTAEHTPASRTRGPVTRWSEATLPCPQFFRLIFLHIFILAAIIFEDNNENVSRVDDLRFCTKHEQCDKKGRKHVKLLECNFA